MAQLKDLIVNGASRFIGDVFANKIQVTTINAPTTAGSSTYGTGSANQALMSNGTSTYWGEVSTTSVFGRGTGEDSIIALNNDSHPDNTADGESAMAIGQQTTATGALSFTMGYRSIASVTAVAGFAGGTKHAWRDYGPTVTKEAAFAYGMSPLAEGPGSIAMGIGTEAKGRASQAFGNYTIASGRSATVIGQCNIEDTDTATYASYGEGAGKYLFIIGNGTMTAQNSIIRSNAMTVDWEGNQWLAGRMTIQDSIALKETSDTHTSNIRFNSPTDQTVANITSENEYINGIAHSDYLKFAQRSYNSSTGALLGYAETYKLPDTTPDLTASATYEILTTKDTLLTDFSHNTTNILSLTVGGTTASTTVIKAVSASWENGTSAGPGLLLYVNGVGTTNTAYIPLASVTYSGVVSSTGSQTFAGTKTFKNAVTFSEKATLNGVVVGNSGVNYGASLPASAVNGQLFFQTSNGGYELPASGAAGYALVKNSGSDRDVKWSNIVPRATADGNGNTISDTYVKKAGDTMTGNLILQKTTTIADNQPATLIFKTIEENTSNSYTGAWIRVYDDGDGAANGTNMILRCGGNMIIGSGENPGNFYTSCVHGITANAATSGNTALGKSKYVVKETGEYLILTSDSSIYFFTGAGTLDDRCLTYINADGEFHTVKTYGAVWNDYAEYRESNIIEPGRVIKENGDDTLSLTTERLERGCEIISDTFGFAIGETEKAKTPTAASGRVLAYPYESREEFKKHIGWPVCSGPEGTVSIMTEEEEIKYSSRVIGTISAVPDYEIWYGGTGKDIPIKINGRVWIRVR